MRIPQAGLAAALLVAAASSQTAPNYFELSLPDLNQTITSGNIVADIPVRPITRLTIQLLGSANTNLNYGDIRVRINGAGVGSLFNRGSNERGKFLAMDPDTLKMRRDPIFDPRENTVEVYGTDPRGRSYYQNWILRSGNENQNPYFTYVGTRSPADESGIPPDLTIDAPALPVAGVTSGKPIVVQVRGSASAAAGITSLTFNGAPRKTAAKATGPEMSVLFSEPVTLAPGVKSLVVEATDAKGNKRSATVPVNYPASGPAPKLAGQSWALIIGISNYTSKAMPPPALPAAAFDAKALAESLKAHGFDAARINLLVDEQATAEQIRNALGDFAARAKPEDFLLVYVVTQGIHDPSAPEKVYLAASDSQGLKLSNTALEVPELQLLLNRAVRSRHALFFFDVEHKLPADWNFQGKSIVNTLMLSLFDGPAGRSILVSGAANQDSQDAVAAAESGHAARGVFSSALVEALEGNADVDHNKVLTAKEICTYVAEQVRRNTGGQQAPRFRYPEKDSDAPLLALP